MKELNYNVDDIKKQVKRVLDYSNEMDSKVDKLIDNWHRAKQKFISEFGGDLIIESPTILTMNKPDEDKISEYRDFVADISFTIHDGEIRKFLLEQGWTSFYENKVSTEWRVKDHIIPIGMKINKALKFFVDIERLEFWQNKYSQIIQDVKINGRLCLSIHPLDYLSISETTHNWRSCHSLEGEYRAGNLSYMNDEVTVIAYLKSEGEYKLPNFPKDVPWNSKKWRMLFYINDDRNLIFSSKPYPFDNLVLVNNSYNMLQEIIKGKWYKNFLQINPDEAIKHIEDALGSVQFNDCISSSTYDPRYKTLEGMSIAQCKPIEVGAPVPCLECESGYIEFCSDYLCVDCGDYVVCEDCGCHMYSNEAYVLDEKVVCPGCYDEYAMFCNGCGEVHHSESNELRYDPQTDEWYCKHCMEQLQTSRIESILELDCD